MNNIIAILEPYVSLLKISSVDESYVYLFRAGTEDILMCPSSTSVKYLVIQGGVINDKYINKMYSVDVIKNKTIGHENSLGLLDTCEQVAIFDAHLMFNKARNTLNSIMYNMTYYDEKKCFYNINTDQDFFTNILSRKSADGSGKYIAGDKVLYLSPNMLPCSKKMRLDLEIYSSNENDFFTARFASYKKPDIIVYTVINFLKV